MTFSIEKLVRERLSQLPARPVLCKCGQEVLFIQTRKGMVAVDLELERHECRKNK